MRAIEYFMAFGTLILCLLSLAGTVWSLLHIQLFLALICLLIAVGCGIFVRKDYINFFAKK